VSTAAAVCPQCGRPAPFAASAARLVDDRFPADAQPVSIAPRGPSAATPPRRPPAPRERSIAAPAVGGIVLALFIGWCSTRAPRPSGPTVAEVAATPRVSPETQIRLAEAAVRAQLKDGESARFTDVRMGRMLDATTGAGAVCGRVNAKNEFGGYGGAQRFVAANEAAFLEEMVARDQWATVWAQFCTDGAGR
jgi:hypothetical protein